MQHCSLESLYMKSNGDMEKCLLAAMGFFHLIRGEVKENPKATAQSKRTEIKSMLVCARLSTWKYLTSLLFTIFALYY